MTPEEIRELLAGDAPDVAPRLLGMRLRSGVGGVVTEVVLTEVEAYTEDDPASHAFRGPTDRNRAMFGRAGLLYVYRSYGVHWCANVVTGAEGSGQAVLVRGGKVVEGRTEVIRRRGRTDHLADGPGKLCQALGITGEHDGTDLLRGGPIQLLPGSPPATYLATPRVGISRATEVRWRFVAVAGEG